MLSTWRYFKCTYRPCPKVYYQLKNYKVRSRSPHAFYKGFGPLASNLNIFLQCPELRTLSYWRCTHLNYMHLMSNLCLFYFWVKYFVYGKLSTARILNTVSLEKAPTDIAILGYALLE